MTFRNPALLGSEASPVEVPQPLPAWPQAQLAIRVPGGNKILLAIPLPCSLVFQAVSKGVGHLGAAPPALPRGYGLADSSF